MLLPALSGLGNLPCAAAIAFSSALDKAVKSNVIHRNSASNHKAQVAKYIFPAKK